MITRDIQENGVDTAIQCIYRDLEYAKNLIKAKAGKNSARRESVTADGADADIDDFDEDEEESWTFVGAGADTADDLNVESVIKTVADLRSSPMGVSGGPSKTLGSHAISGGSGLGARGG